MSDSSLRITGRVVRGLGHGASFTQLEWVKAHVLDAAGIEPYPGTLNLSIDDPTMSSQWLSYRNSGGVKLASHDNDFCDAHVFPVTLNGQVYGAAIYPEVSGYASEQVEILSSVCLRDLLCLNDGDDVNVDFQGPLSVDALIFDVDGTLLNSLDGYLIAVERAIQPHDYQVSMDLIRQSLNSSQEFWHLILPRHEHGNTELIASLRSETMRHWPAVRDEFVGVLPGIAELISELDAGPMRFAICTGSQGESFPPLERAGVLGTFECIVTNRDVENPKPDPEGILQCLARLGVDPASAAYVGDSVVDMRASRAAGVQAIGVLTGAGDSATLTRGGAHRVLPSAARLSTLLKV